MTLAERRSRATIYDIARQVGVSASTVSRALHKPGRVSTDMEERIRTAATALGYRINPMARALPTGRSGALALLLSDITNPVYFPFIRGAERVSSATGSSLFIAESRESAASELHAAHRFQAAADGLVLVASRLDDQAIRDLADATPLVVVNREVDGVAGLIPDLRPGIGGALDHLRTLGHRSLVYLSGPSNSWMSRARWELLLDMAVDRDMNIVEIGPGTPTMEGGAAALLRVRASGATAVLAFNDLMAIGLLRACHAAGIAVPGHLSVVGFDDIFGADLTTPSLTTVRSPLTEMGAVAIRSLLAAVNGAVPVVPETLATELIIRASTSGPRHASASRPRHEENPT
ncbi:LacI family DNA-binding transcriptional regulator [Actinoplanes couchii]|uniref:LacI family transcriptional regulator n=1 Tax=Actinoplanes couchii TaxID=403638 RepID=A0ABQ3XP97_9ACTN|nr:LacI family DNA-binding transcriptional regulator [Actinoplanes couchii]MDR6318639.1 LacI family transcriptional regulator [Actinoplanes couchii]GID60247.1 LacI family transcriptional regulator [Actinoplanes couchii]